MFDQTFISSISNQPFPVSYQVQFKNIDHFILDIIKKKHPTFSESDSISIDELNDFRREYVASRMVAEHKEFKSIRKKGTGHLGKNAFDAEELELDESTDLTFGQRLSDRVAAFGGSWFFIISFLLFIGLWIICNSVLLFYFSFDPYPFIFLNLILSCIAALQAPIIMMSQNRQEDKDRERAKKDFHINLKSELEIQLLHNKLDHLMMHQQQELIEIQKIQMDMLNELQNQIKSLKND
ncbi:MAG: hypothetical protein RLY35_666 [Bacteroidota bacterium]|jgi:uncharacterized membrane protein